MTDRKSNNTIHVIHIIKALTHTSAVDGSNGFVALKPRCSNHRGGLRLAACKKQKGNQSSRRIKENKKKKQRFTWSR